jgi:SAM-dependent methyltransferase
LLALPFADQSWGGIAALYAIIHMPRTEVINALHEFHRVLRPGAWLLLAFHIGDQTMHLDERWGEKVNLDFAFFQPAEMSALLEQVGFCAIEVIEREPYPDVEHPTRRAYLFASP